MVQLKSQIYYNFFIIYLNLRHLLCVRIYFSSVSSGNIDFCNNLQLTSDFNKGIPLGKVTVLAGESGAGKSYIASGNIIKNAQDQGIFVILIDSENALDEQWLQALKVDTI